LVRQRDALGRDDVRFRVRAWPLELVNDAPLEAAFIGDEVDELRAQVAPDLFARFDRRQFPATSLPALMLAAQAYEQGLDAGEHMSLLLRDALFEDGRDIASDDVLADVAARAGVDPATAADRDTVLADWREGRERGVVGSPHFFVGDTSVFCPSLRMAQVDGELRISADTEAFDRFAQDCFAH
jgi:2-hydroxychromene-2-carboxylate isomerase